MATLYKLLSATNADISYAFQIIIVVISIASMTVGNIMALRQANVKRDVGLFRYLTRWFYVNDFIEYSYPAGNLITLQPIH